MTPEGKTKDKIKEVLKRYDVYYHMVVQNGLGAPSLDFICCHDGYFFAVEAKAPGKKPTPRQEKTMSYISRAKGLSFVVAGTEGLDELEEWLRRVH